MNRAEVPDALMLSRRADIDRIPAAALAKMTRADLANRLVAAGEFRQRARQPRQPADTARMYADLAGEILTTTDPQRAAELVKSAGVGVTIGTGRGGARPAAAARTTPRATAANALRKEAAPQVARRRIKITHQPDGTVVTDIGVGDAGDDESGSAAKAAVYEQQAARVTDPDMRRGYLELARRERESAGVR